MIFTQGLKDVNDKLITSNKQHFASFNEIERKLGRISEKLEERPSGKFGGQTQPNPAQNVPSNSGKYVPPSSKTEQANVIISENRSGDVQVRKQEAEAGVQPRDTVGAAQVPVGAAHCTELPENASFCVSDNFLSSPACFESVSGLEKLLEELNGLDSSVKFVANGKENEEMEAPFPPKVKTKKDDGYGNFLELVKSIIVTVPFVDFLSGMPVHGKFMKKLMSSKGDEETVMAIKDEQKSSEVKLAIKLEDPGSFLISCNLNNKLDCVTLSDLGASINLMPYDLFCKLESVSLTPTHISIRLADNSNQIPLGIAENVMVKVGN